MECIVNYSLHSFALLGNKFGTLIYVQTYQPAEYISLIMTSQESPTDFGDEDYKLEELGNSGYQIAFHAPRALYGGLIGLKGSKKHQIESEFGTVLTIPGIRDSGNSTISIKGKSKEDLCKTKKKIESILLSLRKKSFVTHFTCLPACTEEMKALFNQIKANILSDDYPGIDELLFIEAGKIHITFAPCTLFDDYERKKAIQVFKDCSQEFVDRKSPIEVSVRGLKKFADEKPNTVRVIFAGIESPALQELADKVLMGFKKAQVNSEDRGNTAKLHMTIMNVAYRKRIDPNSPKSFDATKLLEKYAEFDFGKFMANEIHLSQLGSKDETGFYKSLCVINF